MAAAAVAVAVAMAYEPVKNKVTTGFPGWLDNLQQTFYTPFYLYTMTTVIDITTYPRSILWRKIRKKYFVHAIHTSNCKSGWGVWGKRINIAKLIYWMATWTRCSLMLIHVTILVLSMTSDRVTFIYNNGYQDIAGIQETSRYDFLYVFHSWLKEQYLANEAAWEY